MNRAQKLLISSSISRDSIRREEQIFKEKGEKKKGEHCQPLLDSMQNLTNSSKGKKNRHRKV